MANEDTVQINSKPRIYWYSEYKIERFSSDIFASHLDEHAEFLRYFQEHSLTDYFVKYI